jgi:hypothetical protein
MNQTIYTQLDDNEWLYEAPRPDTYRFLFRVDTKPNKPSEIHLELSTKNIVNRLEDLRLVEHKVEEVEQLIAEHEWKIKVF